MSVAPPFVPSSAGPPRNPYAPSEWYEIQSIADSHYATPAAMTAVAFDPYEECVWTANELGRISCVLGASLEKCVCVQAHERNLPVRQLLVETGGVASIVQDTLRYHSTGGLLQFTYSTESFTDLRSMIVSSRNRDLMLLGGGMPHLFLFDLNTCRILLQSPSEEGANVIRQSRLLVIGGAKGQLILRDPSTLRVEHRVDAHAESISDIDVKGNMIVSCGYSTRHGSLFVDPFIRVFDIRALRPMAPIASPGGPHLLRFHPSFSSTLVCVMQGGQFQFIDLQGDLSSVQYYRVESEGDPVTCMDVSSSGEVLFFGDAGGFIHQWSDRDDFKINVNSKETDLPDPTLRPPAVSFGVDDMHIPLSAIPVPSSDDATPTTPLSAWPPNLPVSRGIPSLPLPASIAASMKQIDFVGYAQSTDRRRNQAPNIHYDEKRGWVDRSGDPIPALSQTHRRRDPERASSQMNLGAVQPQLSTAISPAQTVASEYLGGLPKYFEHTDIRWNKLDEFDFSFYNRTKLSGLENLLPNSYVNPALQVLFFVHPLRAACTNHLCKKEFCLACELSFLFHMMSESKGVPCQASNLLRAFRQIPEAAALGLLDSMDSMGRPRAAPNINFRIGTFVRFLLEQLSKELGTTPMGMARASASRIINKTNSDMAALSASASASASTNGGESSESTLPSTNLESCPPPSPPPPPPPPPPSPSPPPPSTSPLPLTASSSRDTKLPRNAVEDLFSAKVRWHLFCSGCESESVREVQSFQLDLFYPQVASKKDRPSFASVLQESWCHQSTTRGWCENCNAYHRIEQRRAPSTLPKILAINCASNRPEDMEQWESTGLSSDDVHKLVNASPVEEGIDTVMQRGLSLSWLPFRLRMSIDPESQLLRLEEDRRDQPTLPDEDDVYELSAILCHVREDTATTDAGEAQGHLVSLIHQHISHGGSKEHMLDSHPEWFLINDFTVVPVSSYQAVHFARPWKMPCLVFFAKSTITRHASALAHRNPITKEVFSWDADLTRLNRVAHVFPSSFLPLKHGEYPTRGDIVAIDAEFVSLSPEKVEVTPDGSEVVVEPSRLSLGRVSVVRGSGDLEGTAFIDDYISTPEPILDYLTRWSGLMPGDLDPAMSRHHVTTLKACYLKLRYLVDQGVKFVGHGLKKDFRIINIMVPPDQIIDTVEIYHKKNHRKMSLRFLAWHVLNVDVQSETHDSIEDANTALQLYKKFLELRATGEFSFTLDALYKTGRQTNWTLGAMPSLP